MSIAIDHDAPELVRHHNQSLRRERDRLERPEHHMRPIRVREYWRPPGATDDAVPKELEFALSRPR
jgi:hypothetical protein